MAESPIGQLDEATLIQSFDLFLMEQGGIAKKVKGSMLTAFIDRNVISVEIVAREATQDYTASYDSRTGTLTIGIPRGCGIASISSPSVAGLNKTYTLTWDKAFDEVSAKTATIVLKDGDYITEVVPVTANHTPGSLDTYEIRFKERSAIQFQVYNGNDGQGAPGSSLPLEDGEASAGTALAFSREDHVHPSDTKKQDVNIYFTDKTVATSAWASNNTYTDFPYRAAIACSGVTSTMFADVVFAPGDAINGNFAPVCQTGSNLIYIYAKSIPSASITIPSIAVFKR